MRTLTTSEAADLAGVAEYTIIRWCKAGHVKHRRIGLDGAYAVSSRSLHEYLNARKLAPHGYIHVNTAANYHSNLPVSTLRRMAKDGRLKSKRVNKRLYIHKKSLEEMALTYDAKETRRKNGQRSAAIVGGGNGVTEKPKNQRPPATPQEIAHCQTMAWIENLGKRVTK
jgi:hypothetical protein